MKITSDWHMHSNNSCDGACARIKDIINEAETMGIEKLRADYLDRLQSEDYT